MAKKKRKHGSMMGSGGKKEKVIERGWTVVDEIGQRVYAPATGNNPKVVGLTFAEAERLAMGLVINAFPCEIAEQEPK